MFRSKKDILDTEAMLSRLAKLLDEHMPRMDRSYGLARADAESLRRISMTLRRWHELACGTDNGCIEQDGPNGDGKPFMTYERMSGTRGRYAIPDREAGARKRLAAIMARYPGLTAYVQGDPRGCALYVLKPGDVPEGATVDSCYSRGLAVFQ